MRTPALIASLALALPASAANVYVLSSGDGYIDNYVLTILLAHGHTCTLGPQFYNFGGTPPAGTQTVYLQANNNWYLGEMSAAAGLALRNWVQGGGRLVTCEWVTYYATTGGAFAPIASILPLNPSLDYGNEPSTAYFTYTPDAALDAGVPGSLGFFMDNYAGTQIHTTAKTSATTYFIAPGGHPGLAGWTRGSGSVYSFSTTCGPTQLGYPEFAQLFSNAVGAVPPAPCYANCDASTTSPVLNINDFQCFLNKFAVGDSSANCDGSTTPPILNANDFQCFLNAYAAGCS
jgi:hypothetical protein